MKVYLFKTNETKEVNDSFAARLVEQGKAKVVPTVAAKVKEAPKEFKETK